MQIIKQEDIGTYENINTGQKVQMKKGMLKYSNGDEKRVYFYLRWGRPVIVYKSELVKEWSHQFGHHDITEKRELQIETKRG